MHNILPYRKPHPVCLMKYNEPLRFLPTFYTTFTAITRCFTLAQVRTAFGFSTPILPFFFLVCYFLPFAFEIYYSFLMRCFKPRGECTLAECIDSILSVCSKISYMLAMFRHIACLQIKKTDISSSLCIKLTSQG